MLKHRYLGVLHKIFSTINTNYCSFSGENKLELGDKIKYHGIFNQILIIDIDIVTILQGCLSMMKLKSLRK